MRRKQRHIIALLIGLAFLSACDATTREARRMVKRAEQLADTLPDSTVSLIDSVLRMPANFSERERMDMALLQAEALFGCRDGVHTVSTNTLSPLMDDDFFDEHANLSTSSELERAAAYYAGKKQYANAAHAALYSGFVQQHYNEKESAMKSFKDAELYGEMSKDSLIVARTHCLMGKMMYEDYADSVAISLFKSADRKLGSRFAERAMVQNMMSVCFIVHGDFENAENSLNRSMVFAEQSCTDKVLHKVLNNYAVLYRLQGKYNQAIECLRQIGKEPKLTESEEAILYLNFGNSFASSGEIDSATIYYQHLEDILHNINVKDESRISAYGALSQFAKSLGNDSLALQYREKHERLVYDVMIHRQEQTIYRIQQQYNYESLQNKMIQERSRMQRFVAIGIVLLLCIVALFFYQSSQRNKKEAETNANLFHFMQQNRALVESNIEHEKKVLDTMQQLSNMYYARFKTMQKLSFSIENPKNKIALKDLEKVVFGDGEHWEAVKEVIDALYPGLRESVTYKYPEMDEMERRVFILSRFKLPRMEEAALLGISTSVLDKLRTRVHKIVEKDKKQ